MIDGRIASEAVELVHGDRQDSYGSPRDNLGRIAGMWSAYLGADVSDGRLKSTAGVRLQFLEERG